MTEWISVEDRLPDHGQLIMAYEIFPPGRMFHAIAAPLIGCSYKICEYGTYGAFMTAYPNSYELKHVTHWQPLPEPPKEMQ